LAQDPEVAHLKDGGHEKYDKLVFVSHWQMNDYMAHLGIPHSSGYVLQNAIDPIEEHEKPTDEINLVYFSTPHRGLDILVPVFETMKNEHFKHIKKPINLHVYSSFALYGWPERDEQHKALLDKCKNTEGIIYHGSVPNDEMRENLKKMHILAYPCVWPETSCIVLMEAMSAKLLCVHSSFAGLPETAANWTMMYPVHEVANDHAQIFAQNLFNAVSLLDDDALQQRLHMQKQYADAFYNWDVRAMQWKSFLEGLANAT
jgi:glycosyltransferase involved in cell wall biosynthesis